MKKLVLCLLLLVFVMSIFSCGESEDVTNATIDIASSVNFRCEVNGTAVDEPYNLGENDAVYLFQNCFDKKSEAKKIEGSEISVTAEYIKIFFVGDPVDTAPVKNNKADYSGFYIFSNDVVRFEYNGMTEYYQFSNGFYDFINTYLIIFAE